MIDLHTLLRKLRTFRKIISRCSNWPTVCLAKVGLGRGPKVLRLRDGLQLELMPPLKATWGEIFEPAIADLYGIRQAQPDLIVDVGGNIGAFSCFAARTHPAAVVHAFEPSSEHSRIFETNIALNGLENVVLHREAVTKDGREVIFSARGTGGASGIFRHDEGTQTKLQSTTLGAVSFENSRTLFVKLDCEGAEGEIIEWICRNRAHLPVSVHIAAEMHHWCPVPLGEIIQNLKFHGFEVRQETLFDEAYLFADSQKG
jgi:FkbM family methyltransferase